MHYKTSHPPNPPITGEGRVGLGWVAVLFAPRHQPHLHHMKTVDLREALNIIHSGTWVSLAAVQANDALGTGGKILRLNRAKLLRNRTPTPTPTLPLSGTERGRGEAQGREANHFYNFTRNFITPGNEIIKIHPLLIFEINGHQVC